MIVFPVPLAEFWSLLPIRQLSFDAPPPQNYARTLGGEAWTTDIGDALFTGTVTLDVMTGSERLLIEPLLDVLRPGGRTFWARDSRVPPGPAADPQGHVLGTRVPTLASLPNAREIGLAGLPARYQLQRGDYLSFDRPDGGRCLHQVVDQLVEASTVGTTPAFEVTPPVPQGAVTGVAVTLVGAACKALILPGSLQKGSSARTITEGTTFQFMQTLI